MKTFNRVLCSVFGFSILSVATLTVHAVPGSIVAWGAGLTNTSVDPEWGQSIIPAGLTDVVTVVAAGDQHSVALESDGTVVAWGRNVETQTRGVATVTVTATVNAAPLKTVTLAATNAEIVPGMFVTGPAGTVGIGAKVVTVATTTVTLDIVNLTAIAAPGTVLTFSSGVTATAIAAGGFHTMALKADGSVLAWGAGTTTVANTVNRGQSVIPPGLTTLSVAGVTIPANPSGSIVTVTLTAANNGIIPGMLVTGPFGTVGPGARVVTVATVTPFVVTLSVPNVNVFATSATLKFSTGVVAIAGGYVNSMALRDDGKIFAWGDNTELQTTVPAALAPIKVTATLPVNPSGLINTVTLAAINASIVPGMLVTGPPGTVGTGAKIVSKDGTGLILTLSVPNTNTAAMSPLLTFSSVVAIAAGNAHSVALNSDGTVVAWGRAIEGQTTIPAGLTGVTAIAAGSAHTVALKSDGTVVAWGSNGFGQITIPSGLNNVTSVKAGANHTVALKSNTTVVAWGQIYNGSAWYTETVPASLIGVTDIAAGAYHTLALGAPQPPVITTQPVGVTVSQGDPASFTVVATATSGLTYQWMKNGVNIAGATSATYTIPAAQAADAGHYTVRCTATAGSVVSDAAILTVTLTVPPVITSQPLSVVVRLGIDDPVASFDVKVPAASNYQWWKNGLPILGATSEVLSFLNVTLDDVGSYSVVAWNDYGIVTSQIATLQVIPEDVVVRPTITSSLATLTLTEHVLITPYQITSNTEPKSYSAKGLPKGLKVNSKTGLITGTPTKLGTYLVTLQVKSKSAGTASATKTFIVQP